MSFFTRVLLYSGMVVMFFAACERIERHEPMLKEVVGSIEHPSSNISIPLALNLQEVEDLVNEKLDGEIYNDPSFEGDNLKLSISKIGRIEVSLVGNKLYYKLPLHIWLEGRIEKKVLGAVKVRKDQELDFSLVLHFCSSLGIDQQWKPVVHTELLRYEWVKKPSIKVAFLKVGIASIIEKKVDEQMDGLLSKIDASIHQKLDVKPMAMKVWMGIQKPIRINRKVKDVWLVTTPEKLYISHINGRHGHLLVNLRLEASMQTVVGDSPTLALHTELPPLLSHQDTSSHFDIYVKSTLEFDMLNESLNEQVGKKKLQWDDYKVNVGDFEVMGSDSMLVLKVGVGGDIHGDVYFQGRPEYDSLSGILKLDSFDFHLASEEVLFNTADWLMHDHVLDRVQDELALPIGDKLGKLPELINNAISKSKVSKKVDVRLEHLRLVPQRTLVTSTDLQLLVYASGNLHLDIERLK